MGGLGSPCRVIIVTEDPVTKKLSPIEVELNARTQEAVREAPVRREDGSLTTVGALVEEARRAFEQANQAIRDNALIQLTAAHLMRKEKRRGSPSVVIHMDGTVALRIIYGEAPEEEAPLVVSATPKKKLPSLDSLRKDAAEAGVDISDLGRKKRAIMQRLAEASESGDDTQ